MASGRFLSASIATDTQLALLSIEAEWLYLHSIPHLDRDGMITADPIQLLLQIAPLRFSTLAPRVAHLVDEWIAVGLVIRFATPAGPALFYKGFLKNQTLRYDRERPSLYPPPPGYINTDAGLRPATYVPWVDQSSNETPGVAAINPPKAPILPEFQPLTENVPQIPANNSSPATPGYYPKNPAETPILPDSPPQAAEEAESAAPKQQESDKQQQAERPAAAADPLSEARRLLFDFGVREPSLSRVVHHPPDVIRGGIDEALRGARRRRKPIEDPVAFLIARLSSATPPAPLAEEPPNVPEAPDAPTPSYQPASLPPPPEPETPAGRLWRLAQGEIQLQLTPDIYEMYIHGTRARSLDDDSICLVTANKFVHDWLDLRLRRVLQKTLSAIHGAPITIVLEQQSQLAPVEAH